VDNDDSDAERARRIADLAARGALAGGVAEQLAMPLARVHDAIGHAVERLDRHFAEARGPDPLPLAKAVELREVLGVAFLELGRAARLASDLAYVVAMPPEVGELDVNDLVSRAIALARHGLGPDGEILSDLGTPPAVRADGTRLAHALAHLILGAIADAGAGGQVSVATREGDGGDAVIRVSPEHGTGLFAELVAAGVSAAGGSMTRAGEVAEIRLPAVGRSRG
jgi:signal transduction histidine kinase